MEGRPGTGHRCEASYPRPRGTEEAAPARRGLHDRHAGHRERRHRGGRHKPRAELRPSWTLRGPDNRLPVNRREVGRSSAETREMGTGGTRRIRHGAPAQLTRGGTMFGLFVVAILFLAGLV